MKQKTKKLLLISAILIGTLLYGSMVANAETVANGTCGDNLTWTLDNEGLLTISGEGAMKNYDPYDGDDTPWYSNRELITSVIIESGVTSISKYAFDMCINIKEIFFSETLTSIGTDAFYGCISLENISVDKNNTKYYDLDGVLFSKYGSIAKFPPQKNTTEFIVPYGVTSISDSAFEDCKNLTSVILPDNITSIGESAFSGCSSLISIDIPNGVEVISDWLFQNCSNLETVTFPQSVNIIGDSIFSNCFSLKNVILPENVEKIGDGIFTYCHSLQELKIPAGITKLPVGMFYGCYNLKNIIIPESVTTISSNAFYNCDSLQSITVPMGVTKIYNWAFAECENLKSIFLPSTLTNISDDVFKNTQITNIYYNGTEEQWDNIKNFYTGVFITSAKKHYNVNSILSNAQVTKTAENSYTYSFNMNAYEPVAGTFIVALYNGNKFVGIANEDLSVENTSYTASNKPITTSGDATSYKIFFWSSLDGMTPLCNSIDGFVE